MSTTNIQRSSSVGAQPRPKKLFTSRAESVAAVALDVRCACQFFQTTSLLPERVNPVGSRPTSSMGYSLTTSRPNSRNECEHNLEIFEPNLQRHSNSDAELLSSTDDQLGSNFSFGEVIGDTDYYAESVVSSRPNSPTGGAAAATHHHHHHHHHHHEDATSMNQHQDHHLMLAASSQCLVHQKNPAQSVLLQRRASRMSSDQQPVASTTTAQIDPSKSVLLQRRSVQRSTESIAIKQLDPCSSTLLMRKRSSIQAQQSEPISDPSYSFKPIVPVVVPRTVQPPPPITSYPRGPYPGEAYPDHDAYDRVQPSEVEAKAEEPPSYGIGIVELLSLGTSLVQRREQRYCERSNEDVRGRSRRSRKEKAEKEKQEKEERRKEKEAAAAERKLDDKRDDRKTPEPDSGAAPTISSLPNHNVDRGQLGGQSSLDPAPTQQQITRPITQPQAQSVAQLTMQPQATAQTATQPPTPPGSPLVYIGKTILIDDPSKSDVNSEELNKQKRALEVTKSPPPPIVPVAAVAAKTIEQPIVNYHETTPAPKLTKNTEVSVAANSLISTLMTNPLASKFTEDKSVKSSIEKMPQMMRQRDPSQSSLLRSRYSSDRESVGGVVVRQRDPSQSSMLRQRYSIDRDSTTASPVASAPGTVMRQRDPSQSSMLRQRYSMSIEPMGGEGSQTNVQSNLMRQKDPSTSSLLMQKRMHARSHSQDNYGPVEKISKTVSFEYDKKLTASGQVADVGAFGGVNNSSCSKAEFVQRMQKMSTEMRDKMDWIERTYNTRDHEYEPIEQPTEVAVVDPPKLATPPPPQPEPSTEFNNDVEMTVAEEINNNITEENNQVDAEQEPTDEIDLQSNDVQESESTPPRLFTSNYVAAPEPDEMDEQEFEESAAAASSSGRKKSFIASANDRTKQMQAKLSGQADRLRTKIKGLKKPKKSESPKADATERKRFRSPEFANKLKNINMPKIHRPEFKRPDLKRPEFTKFKRPDFSAIKMPARPNFTKPDMSKFKLPDRLASMRRSKSMVESTDDSIGTGTTAATTEDLPAPTKKRFDFGTYPRIFNRLRRQSKPEESSTSRDYEQEADEESDRVQSPITFGTFPKMGKKASPPVSSLWSSNTSNMSDSESGQFQRYTKGDDRESSVERRMRETLEYNEDREDNEDRDEADERKADSVIDVGDLQTEEQRQLAEYDEENRVIHQISRAREDEFRQRKPFIHQDSDVMSDEAASVKDYSWVENDLLRKRLHERSAEATSQRDVEEFVGADRDRDRSSIAETQSSGSSSNRRRKGVIEEIDDDEFYLRKKGISQDDIQMGMYISSAIRDQSADPITQKRFNDRFNYDQDEFNSNEGFEGYDRLPPTKPVRVKDFEKSLESSEFNMDNDRYIDDHTDYLQHHQSLDYGKAFPPNRPLRRRVRQLYSEERDEHQVPVAAQYYPHPDVVNVVDDDDDVSFYDEDDEEAMKPFRTENILFSSVENGQQQPPIAPKRRKKLMRESMERDMANNNNADFGRRSLSNTFISNGNVDDIVVYRTEHEYIIPMMDNDEMSPLAAASPPQPIPRSRSRSRSEISPLANENSLAFERDDGFKYIVKINENDDYATVNKEPPPRPPAPVRNRGGTQFSTMPHAMRRKERAVSESATGAPEFPERPIRNYSTIGPTRPPRRTSINSLVDAADISQSINKSDATQYEEIDNFDRPSAAAANRDLSSGNTLNKMKHRPLPPPPRPPRERKGRKLASEPHPNDNNDNDDNDDGKHDKGGGGERLMIPTTLEDISRISSVDMEEIEESEAATQTDPVPDEEFVLEFDDNLASTRRSKTLEDILKEEQQAELDRAKQIADEEYLTKGIQKFRDSNQRSYSERSRGSDRPKTPTTSRPGSRGGSRPITPSAMVIERKETLSTTETAAKLIVKPVLDESARVDSLDDEYSDVKYVDDTADTEDERIVSEALRRYRLLDQELQRDAAIAKKLQAEEEERKALEVEQQEREERLRAALAAEEFERELKRMEAEEQLRRDLEELEEEERRLVALEQEEADAKRALLARLLQEQQQEEEERLEAEAAAAEKVIAEAAAAAAEEEAFKCLHIDQQAPAIPPRHQPLTTTAPTETDELPLPPPRRRSLAELQSIVPQTSTELEPVHAAATSSIIPDPPMELLRGGRLHVSELEVDTLSVSALQAGRILVSDLQAISLNSQGLECKSGNLVVRGIELPAGFMEELVDRVRSSERNQPPRAAESVVDEPAAPVRPPSPINPPSYEPQSHTVYSLPPAAFYQLADYPDQVPDGPPTLPLQQPPQTPSRRRRHHRRRDDYSTSEEDYQRCETRRSGTRHSTRSPEPSIANLSGQLIRACSASVGRAGSTLIDMIRAATTRKNEETNRAETNLGIVIVIFIVAVLIMLGMGAATGRPIHHHHWDYFNPPENQGRN